MINFRYHVVSLTAVFLALAIGLVVGTAALNGPVADNLQHEVNQISGTNKQLRGTVTSLETELGQKEQFANEVAPALLAGQLAGRRVLVVSMQQSSQYVDGVVTDLNLAGAKVTGKVEIEDHFTDPARSATLLDLAETSLNTTTISGLPSNSDGVETSAALLASVLMDHTPAVPSGVRTAVLSSYQSMQFITVTGTVTEPAEAVLFLVRPPYVDQNSSDENTNMVTMVDQFDKAGPIVVGEQAGGGSGNVIGAITGDATLSKSVSTVDNVDTPQGCIAAALALKEQVLNTGSGHYGVGTEATSLIPKFGE